MKLLKQISVFCLAACTLVGSHGQSRASYEVSINLLYGSGMTSELYDYQSNTTFSNFGAVNNLTTFGTSSTIQVVMNAFVANASATGNSFSLIGLNVTSTNYTGQIALTFTVSQTGYSQPPEPFKTMNSTTNVNLQNAQASATYNAIATGANGAMLPTNYSMSYNSGNPFVTGGSSVSNPNLTNPYSLTSTFTLTFASSAPTANTNGSSNSLNFSSTLLPTPGVVATVAPAPPALLLGVIGLPALAFARRLRRKVEPSTAA